MLGIKSFEDFVFLILTLFLLCFVVLFFGLPIIIIIEMISL